MNARFLKNLGFDSHLEDKFKILDLWLDWLIRKINYTVNFQRERIPPTGHPLPATTHYSESGNFLLLFWPSYKSIYHSKLVLLFINFCLYIKSNQTRVSINSLFLCLPTNTKNSLEMNAMVSFWYWPISICSDRKSSFRSLCSCCWSPLWPPPRPDTATATGTATTTPWHAVMATGLPIRRRTTATATLTTDKFQTQDFGSVWLDGLIDWFQSLVV